VSTGADVDDSSLGAPLTVAPHDDPPSARPPTGPPGGPTQPVGPRSWARSWRSTLEWVAVLLVAVAAALLLRTYVVQTYYIPSLSMYPTLLKGDHILVLKAAYDFTSPVTGDVVVFRAPTKERELCDDPEVQDLVKRVIGTPGETIWSKGNTIYINNKPLIQRWQHVMQLGTPITRQRVPKGDYFVMGDNHPASCDSRVWGYVPRDKIIGKAILIYWPLSRLSII
jgi:signal peptidase I